MKKTLCLIMICLMAVMLFAACGGSQEPQEAEEGGIDYMALVNKEYPLPDGWAMTLRLRKKPGMRMSR